VRNRGVAKTRHSSAEPFNSSTLGGGPKLERKGISWSRWESSLVLYVPPVAIQSTPPSSQTPLVPDQGFRVLVIATHRVQYMAPCGCPCTCGRCLQTAASKGKHTGRSPIPQHRKYDNQKRKRQRKHDRANQVLTNHVGRDQVSTQPRSQKKNRRHHLLMRKVITCAGDLASSSRIYRLFDRAFALGIQSERTKPDAALDALIWPWKGHPSKRRCRIAL
jgi:hypothetical protein